MGSTPPPLLSSGLIKAETLSISGAQAGAIQVTNLDFDNLNVSGNLMVNNQSVATQSSLALKAPLASPALSGIPTAPTAALGTSTTQLATTEFVQILNKYDNMYEVLQMSKPVDQDVYDIALNNGGSIPYTSLITDDDINVSVKLFSDSSRDEIDSHILSDFPVPAGKFYYYPNLNTSNDEAPVYVDTTDTSGYKYALQKTYSYAPTTTEYTIYTSKVLDYIPYNCLSNSTKLIDTYYKQRGFSTATPQYHSSKANLFATQIAFDYTNEVADYGIGIEFEYDENNSPIKLWLSIAPYEKVANMGLFINDKATIDSQENSSLYYVQPQEVPITSKISEYIVAKDTPERLAYYDKINRRIHIHSPGTKTQISSGSAPTFNETWDETFSFGNFEGSFQVIKKLSDGTLTPCSPLVPESMLVQISNQVSFDWTFNDTTNSILFNLTTDDKYSGLYITKLGMGRDSYPIYTSRGVSGLWTNVDVSEHSTGVGGRSGGGTSRNIGDNPYTTSRERFANGTMVTLSDKNDAVNTFMFKLNGITKSQLYNSTPEEFAALNVLNSQVVSTPGDAVRQGLLHELYHGTVDGEVSGWAKNNINTEANALALNLVTEYFMNGIDSSGNDIGDVATITARWEGYFMFYMMYLYRGNHTRSHTYYSAKTNNLKDYTNTTSMYGESMFILYMMFQEDPLFQILRRTNDILNVTTNYFFDNGLVNGGTKAISVEAIHEAERQAFRELMIAKNKVLSYEEFFSNFCVSMLFLRNNSSIPDKYKTNYNFSVYNRSADYRQKFINQSRSCSIWSDLDHSRPINPKEKPYNSTSLPSFVNTSIVPMWPRVNSSGVIDYRSGSWDSSGTTWTPSSFAYATSINDTNNSTDERFKLVYEDLTCLSYVIPTGTVTGTPTAGMTTGVSTKINTITINVHRGDWAINVVQFIPDGSGGIWRERGWSSSHKEGIYDDEIDDWVDASGDPLSTTIDFSSFTPEIYNGITYFPKLVCVNRGVHGVDDYGRAKATYSDQRRFTGRLSFTATVL